MTSHRLTSTSLPAWTVIALFLLTGCTHASRLVGMWREVGKTATLEFLKDGSFRAVDNEGMAVSGKYALLENGRVEFKIQHPDSCVEIVILRVSRRGDELTVVTDHPGEAERYRLVEDRK